MTSTLHSPVPLTDEADPRTTRLGAAAGIAAVVLIGAGFALLASADATIQSSDEEVVAYYTGADMTTTVAGGFVEILGLLLLLPFATMLTARLRGPGAARLLAPTARSAAGMYVTLALAPGMAAGAAALWIAQSGTPDPAIVTALNDLRALSYFISLLPFALFLGAAGVAATTTRRLPRWAAWSAVALAVGLAATVPVATSGLLDIAGLLALVWVLAVSVSLLRRPGA